MPPLQVKDCPADVYERLRQCAKEENRSIAQQALTIIENYLDLRDRDETLQIAYRNRLRPSPATARNEVDYAEKHRKAIERLTGLPLIPVADGLPSSAELIRQVREEEAR